MQKIGASILGLRMGSLGAWWFSFGLAGAIESRLGWVDAGSLPEIFPTLSGLLDLKDRCPRS